MSYHTFAYSGATGVSTTTNLTAIADGILAITNSHVIPGQDMYLYGAASTSATLTRSRITTPSLRQVGACHIRPLNGSQYFPDNPKMATFFDSPLKLRSQEEIIVDGFGTTNVTAYTVLHAGTGIETIPSGDPITIRATGATTVTAGQWTQVALTYDDAVSQGTYAVVGVTFQGTTCVAGRLIFDNQVFRPGALGITALASTEHPAFQQRRFGVLGKFRSLVMPRAEFLCDVADTAQVVYLQVIRIGA